MFQKLFGASSRKNAAPTVSSQTTSRTVDAIQKLSETEELLVKRQEVLDRKIALELERAREYLRAKNKRGATLALKKKKIYEQQHQQLESQLERVSEQQSMLENQRTVVETVDAMRVAAHASKQVMTEMRIGDVDKVLDLISEQAEGMRQIQDALGTPVGPAADMDEDDLRNELEELEAEELDSQLLEPAPVPVARVPASALPATQLPAGRAPQRLSPLPAAPAHAASRTKTPEELELEELQAELAA